MEAEPVPPQPASSRMAWAATRLAAERLARAPSAAAARGGSRSTRQLARMSAAACEAGSTPGEVRVQARSHVWVSAPRALLRLLPLQDGLLPWQQVQVREAVAVGHRHSKSSAARRVTPRTRPSARRQRVRPPKWCRRVPRVARASHQYWALWKLRLRSSSSSSLPSPPSPRCCQRVVAPAWAPRSRRRRSARMRAVETRRRAPWARWPRRVAVLRRSVAGGYRSTRRVVSVLKYPELKLKRLAKREWVFRIPTVEL